MKITKKKRNVKKKKNKNRQRQALRRGLEKGPGNKTKRP